MDGNHLGLHKKNLRKMLYIYIALLLVLIFSSRTIYNLTLPRVTVAMPESGRLTKELEARGVIGFSETFDIYSASSGRIDEMLIRRGDLVNENTVIATYRGNGTNTSAMDFTIERINNQLSGLALNRTAIQDRLRSLNTDDSDDLHSYQWAVADAEAELERRQAELLDAQRLMDIPFSDFLGTAQATTDFEREWNRKAAELSDAEAALRIAEGGDGTHFDDFIYQRNINEAAITLERRQSELKDAEDALSRARNNGSSSFDKHTYQNAINSARTAYDRSNEDYNEAFRQYDRAAAHYNLLVSIGADSAEIVAAQRAVDDAQNLITSTRRALDDTNAALGQATSDMRRAENAFDENRNESRKQAVTEAEARVTQAGFALEDAERAYENAVLELNRARQLFNTNTEESMEKATNDAKKRVETALSALNDKIWVAQKNLSQAETNLANAETVLERAKANLDLAQSAWIAQADEARKSLGLDLQRADLDIANASLDLREAAVSLESGSDTGDIRADYQGIVISVEKNRGQFVSQGEKIATVGVNNNIFTSEITVSDFDGRFIEIGDEANIIRSGGGLSVRAVVYSIAFMGDTLKISLVCETDVFIGGEFVTVKFQKQTQVYHTIVPNEAIFSEGMGNFVWIIQSRQGALGIEYFTTKVRVLIADSDDFYTAVSRGLEMQAPVVVNHDKDLTVNARVSRME